MGQKKYYIILGIIGFLIVGILAFDVYVFKFGKFWEKQTPPQRVILPTPSPESQSWASNPLVQKAKEIGYNIIWMDLNDTTGRTVFYDNRQKADFNFPKTGIVYTQPIASGSSNLISYIGGTVQSFEKIESSEDEYIKILDPTAKISLPKIRLIFSENSAKQTSLIVENLSYGQYNPYDFKKSPNKGLGGVSKLGKTTFKKIVKLGDAVVLNALSKTNSGKIINETDENKELVGVLVVVRRFEGKTQVEKELGNSL